MKASAIATGVVELEDKVRGLRADCHVHAHANFVPQVDARRTRKIVAGCEWDIIPDHCRLRFGQDPVPATSTAFDGRAEQRMSSEGLRQGGFHRGPIEPAGKPRTQEDTARVCRVIFPPHQFFKVG
jgi:hypothetical protein